MGKQSVVLPPFWLLVEAHGDELVVHARRLAGSAAEDIVQEALLRALAYYPRVQRADHLRAWLYRITTRVAWDHLRRGAREVPVADVSEAADADAGEPSGFEELIAPLSPGARQAMRLRFVDDLDYAGMGARLGCSPAAARQRVSSALRSLRRRTFDYG